MEECNLSSASSCDMYHDDNNSTSEYLIDLVTFYYLADEFRGTRIRNST